MDFRAAYIDALTRKMQDHMWQAMMIYQMIQQAQIPVQQAQPVTNVTVANPDQMFPPVDLSFLD